MSNNTITTNLQSSAPGCSMMASLDAATDVDAAWLLEGDIAREHLMVPSGIAPDTSGDVLQACCGTIWTAGCSFASRAPQDVLQACCGTIWTAGCSFASRAPDDVVAPGDAEHAAGRVEPGLDGAAS
ncbi:hypothetical protein [Sorangium sp. So ce426]|uniref:hypothetical protein n=1 Tax=Sorangium sp. So ce426 TaxID=3133312 RepID=UPI003F5B684F